MHLQYILSCPFLSLSCQGLWNQLESDQWEAVYPLFTGGFGGGQFYHALQRPCYGVEAAGCRGLFRFPGGVPERDSLMERQLLNNKK